MWMQERPIGDVLDRRELDTLIKTSYELVVAKLPKSKRPGVQPAGKTTRKQAGRTRTRAVR
jgi:predicted DNA-binding protein (MmcQ/YjbR family)